MPTVLISDFGESAMLGSLGTGTGTMEFVAPEVLLAISPTAGLPRQKHQSTKSDLWSCGIVLYYLAYARIPYSQVEDVDVLRREISLFTVPDLDASCHQRVGGFIEGMIVDLLNLDPDMRPSCLDLLIRIKGNQESE